jgi:hypothetical protein
MNVILKRSDSGDFVFASDGQVVAVEGHPSRFKMKRDAVAAAQQLGFVVGKGGQVSAAPYISALKKIVAEKRKHGVFGRRTHEDQRSYVRQQAALRVGLEDNKVYVSMPIGRNKIPTIYQLSHLDVDKWAKHEYRVEMLTDNKIGKLVFQAWQGSWHSYPVDTRRETTSISSDTPEGEVIWYKTVDYEKSGGRYGMADALKQAVSPRHNDMRHYKALVAESQKVGWPASFASDLTKHDQQELKYRNPDLPFGWVLRDSGTQLIFPEKAWDGKMPSAAAASIVRSFGNDVLFYTWDGLALVKRHQSTWEDWMDKEYRSANEGTK